MIQNGKGRKVGFWKCNENIIKFLERVKKIEDDKDAVEKYAKSAFSSTTC